MGTAHAGHVRGLGDQQLMLAARDFIIANVGCRANESLRLEKSFQAWGVNIRLCHTPLEAGLGWAVDVDYASLGGDAIFPQHQHPVMKSVTGFKRTDPDLALLRGETKYRDDERVG